MSGSVRAACCSCSSRFLNASRTTGEEQEDAELLGRVPGHHRRRQVLAGEAGALDAEHGGEQGEADARSETGEEGAEPDGAEVEERHVDARAGVDVRGGDGDDERGGDGGGSRGGEPLEPLLHLATDLASRGRRCHPALSARPSARLRSRDDPPRSSHGSPKPRADAEPTAWNTGPPFPTPRRVSRNRPAPYRPMSPEVPPFDAGPSRDRELRLHRAQRSRGRRRERPRQPARLQPPAVRLRDHARLRGGGGALRRPAPAARPRAPRPHAAGHVRDRGVPAAQERPADPRRPGHRADRPGRGARPGGRVRARRRRLRGEALQRPRADPPGAGGPAPRRPAAERQAGHRGGRDPHRPDAHRAWVARRAARPHRRSSSSCSPRW